MKANKILLIIQTAMMYVAQLPIYVLCFIPNEASFDSLKSGLIGAYLILSALILPICIINAVFSIVSLFKGHNNPSKVTMVVKFALIPWFVINFVICAVLVAGFLNPWLLLAVPLLVCILVFLTYVAMISTSLPDIAFFFNKLFKKQLQSKSLLVVAVVFLFIFCLDTIGGLLFFLGSKDL